MYEVLKVERDYVGINDGREALWFSDYRFILAESVMEEIAKMNDIPENIKQELFSIPEPEFDTSGIRLDFHRKVCDSLHNLYERKNHDYGDAFAVVRKSFPNAVLFHIFEKYLRIKTLMEGNSPKVKESIQDSLQDLANYCLMEIVEMQAEETKNEV